jgi:predicted Zn-dependent protease
MSLCSQVRDTPPRGSGRSSRPFSGRIVRVLVFACPLVSFLPGAAGQQSSLPIEVIDRPAIATLDRVALRNGANKGPAIQGSQGKGDTCLLPPLDFLADPMVPAARLQIPTKAKKEYGEACIALTNNKTEKAEKNLRKAVQEYPKYSAAWVTLGQVLALQQRADEARTACAGVAIEDPSYVPAYLCLADLAARAHDWDDVLRLSSRALEFDPTTNPVTYEYHAAANLNLNKLADAERSGLRAVGIDVNHHEPRVHFVLAQIYEAEGDTANEVTQLQEYLKFAGSPDDAAAVKQYLSELEKRTGK